ncbi:transglycosylase SLT domain-containing protein [Thiorhodococcus minor]|uniref:Lytic transglycosylase domain-containing protein n=1 Tax=Thiorhodococcus minor TaxID=57489 RepID=A0A6M0JY40_9GAMM|nr:transglycosylase SLT domain-containing protein [Thiorhodococcus minor]NEV62420.1 lytic transglycosylase domain-containing protein [Thiorhodococcus minor]
MLSFRRLFLLLLGVLGSSATVAETQPAIRVIAAATIVSDGMTPPSVTRDPGTFLHATASRGEVLPGQARATSGFLQGTLWQQVAERHGLDPTLLYAVALQESRHRAGPRRSAPWPYTLRGPEGPQFLPSRPQAARALGRLMAKHGALSIDVGLMQVNLHWHGGKVADPAQLLDARTNLEIAADILVEAIRSAPGDLELGVGRYHHWKDERIARAYGRRVLRMARAMAAS